LRFSDTGARGQSVQSVQGKRRRARHGLYSLDLELGVCIGHRVKYIGDLMRLKHRRDVYSGGPTE